MLKEFPESWRCPRCKADKTHLELLDYGKDSAITIYSEEESLPFSRERHEFRHGTEPEEYVSDIHTMASTGRSLIEPMRTKKSVVSWDDILIMGAQIAKIPLNEDILVNTTTVIGPNAKRPLVIETPLFVTHMSFGALSRETKIALAMGTAAVKTAIGSGEGGILDEERKYAYRYIFEYVPNRYSVTDENLAMVDAIEIKLGQSAEPGLGARLPKEKVTPEIARVRGYPEGKDIISPASYPDIQNQNDLKRKIEWLQSQSGGRPVGVKIAAGNVEKDLVALLHARPDFITIDGRPGATGAAPKYIKAATSVPT
ncbi:MAG: glutamate synthase, partial [Methanomicrobiales archaeon]|nr:glutamate synthase [Methanomicrobiales archaeon]